MNKFVRNTNLAIGATILVCVGAVSLVGCATTPNPTEAGSDVYVGEYNVIEVEVVEGQYVTCVYVDGGYDGGPSCDWVGYHQKYDLSLDVAE